MIVSRESILVGRRRLNHTLGGYGGAIEEVRNRVRDKRTMAQLAPVPLLAAVQLRLGALGVGLPHNAPMRPHPASGRL